MFTQFNLFQGMVTEKKDPCTKFLMIGTVFLVFILVIKVMGVYSLYIIQT